MFKDTQELLSKFAPIVDQLFASKKEDLAYKVLGISREIIANTIVGSLPPSNILVDASNLFKDCGIIFAVIDGIAINAYGQFRATQDIDFLVSQLPSAAKLRDAEYMARFNFYKGKSATGTVLTLDHRSGQGYIELLVANSSLDKFSLKTSNNINILGLKVPVVSLECLISLKLKAISNNPKRESKDASDIVAVGLHKNIDFSKVKKFLTKKELALLNKYLGANL